MDLAIHDLENNYSDFENDFFDFFKDLSEFSDNKIIEINHKYDELS